jgi:hypothetical protein
MVSICSISGLAGGHSTIFFARRSSTPPGGAPGPGFQAVEQTRQGRAFNADALGQLTLGRGIFETRQVQQHQPARLGQIEPGQAAVQFGTPAPGHLGQLHAEAVLVVGQGHKQLMSRSNY